MSRQNPVEYIGENAEASSKNVAENVEKVFKDLDQKSIIWYSNKRRISNGSNSTKACQQWALHQQQK